MSKNIPKKINYFWFGKKPKPESVKKCIRSWKKYCPDYEIIEWNEGNYDINRIKFCKEAYNNKTWAYVVDAARLDVIYNYGGFYFDTDVEIVKSLDPLLSLEAFGGFESEQYVNPGCGFGAVPKNKIIGEFLDKYNNISFNKFKDDLGKISIPVIVTKILEEKGLVRDGSKQVVGGMTLFPTEYFAPKDLFSRIINLTDNTYSIHHYDASWVDNKEKSIINELDKKGAEVMKKFPILVSIIIPVYNGANFMRKAIDSALSQTYRNIEVIVVNDGSKDDTEKIAKEYGSRIRYIYKENGGVASAMNVGIAQMRGKYFSWLSHDDMYYPEKIEQLIKKAEKAGDNTIIVSDWSIVDENDTLLRNNRLDDVLETNPKAFLAFDRKTWLNGCAMLIPAALFKKYGLFDETLRTTQDYEMYQRFMKNGVKFKIVHKPLIYSRTHSQQGSAADPKALENSDLIHTSIINDLSNMDIKRYFGFDYAKAVGVYDSFFSCGYKRVPAYLASSVVGSYISNNKLDLAKNMINEKMIGKDISLSRRDLNKYLKVAAKKSSKKRILLCSGHWLTGGVERVLSNLCGQLGRKYELYLITPYDGRDSSIALPPNVTHIKISNDLFYNHFDTTILSYALLFHIDLVIGFMNLFEGQLSLYHLCKGTNIKTIASNHEYYFFPYKAPYFYNLVAKRQAAFTDADAVLWLTNFSAAVYGSFNNNGYLMPNPNTYSVQAVNSKHGNKKVVLCVGRFNDYVKRIDRILQCFKIVQTKLPESELVLVGKCDRCSTFDPNNTMTINDLIINLGIDDSKVLFVGESNKMSDYYSNANVLLLASNNEGFSMSISEAACYGVPTVCNYYPGIEDMISDGRNGFITPQNDIVLMANKVCEILSNRGLARKLGANAMKMIDRYNPVIIGGRWTFLIETIFENCQQDALREKLNERLAYKINDYEGFSKILASELNEIFTGFLKTGEQATPSDVGILSKKMLVQRLRNYIKAHGKKAAIKKIARMIAERIFK